MLHLRSQHYKFVEYIIPFTGEVSIFKIFKGRCCYVLRYLNHLPNPHEDEINTDLIYNVHDIPLVDLVIDAMKEFEVIDNVKILDYKVILDQDEVDMNYHKININFKKNDPPEIPNFKYISTGRYGEIVFTIQVKTNLNEKTFEKRILIPLEHEGKFVINSKKYKAIWQMLEASVYTQRGRVTLKARMPIVVYRNMKRSIYDIEGNEYIVASFSYALATKSKRKGAKQRIKFIDPLMIFSAKIGLNKTLEFFGMKGIIELIDMPKKTKKGKWTYFKVDDIYFRVDTHMFECYPWVQSVCAMLYNLQCKDFPLTWERRNDRNYWICRIGFVDSARTKTMTLESFKDKGLTTIYMIERLLDKITTQILRLPDYYKQSIYYLLFWILMNFEDLKSKNNIDLNNKRIRKNEYIVNSSLGKKISENINRIIEKKSKSKMNTIDTLIELFNFPSDIIIAGITTLDDLMKSDDLVNDMDALLALNYSSKGPNSLGENSAKKISKKYRALDISHVGKVDLNTTSNSEPGMAGSFTPFVEIYDGFYFDPNREPYLAQFIFEMSKRSEVEVTADGVEVMKFRDDEVIPEYITTPEEFIEYLEKNDKFQKQLIYEPIKIVEKEEIPDPQLLTQEQLISDVENSRRMKKG